MIRDAYMFGILYSHVPIYVNLFMCVSVSIHAYMCTLFICVTHICSTHYYAYVVISIPY